MDYSKYDNSIIESDLANLVRLFQHDTRLINSDMVKRVGIGRTRPAQYRRELLKLALDRGIAKRNNRRTTASNKYGVYFNIEEEITQEYYFDRGVLSSPLLANLPPREYLSQRVLSFEQREEWINQKQYWEAIHQIFCWYQYPEISYVKIKLNTQKEYLIGAAIIYARMYKAIKLGWVEVEKILEQRHDIPSDYNQYFLEYLLYISCLDFDLYLSDDKSIKRSSLYTNRLALRKAAKEGITSPEQYLQLASCNINHKIAFQTAIKFFDKNTDPRIKEVYERRGFIKSCLAKSLDTKVQKALEDWLEAETELENIYISFTRLR